MKKVRLLLFAFLCVTFTVAPALTGINRASAMELYDDDSIDDDDSVVTDAAAAVGAITGIVKALFCPSSPQNRCKHGVCSSGACVSFRAACSGSGSC